MVPLRVSSSPGGAGIRPSLLIACLLILLTLGAAGAHLQATSAELSRFNPGWNGTAAFFSLSESLGAVIHSPNVAPHDQPDRYILIAPDGTDAEPIVRGVLAAGGIVIIADEDGGANELLEALGLEMRIRPGNVSSVDMEFASPRTVRATVSSNHSVLQGVETLVFNRPSSIEGGEPLVRTSVLSWIDHDGDGSPGSGEELGRYTLMASEKSEIGDVILIADASLFASTMQQVRRLHDNQRLLFNLLDSDSVMVDAMYGRPADADGPAYLVHTVKSAPISSIIVIFLLMMVVAFAFRRQIL
ncbi:hypothetical protein RJ53_04745 [Methanocalculus chunghsingensis]|uniref:DUF4350 domain-containing protein n=1 Tax=Methanocalculus chunghsingensis TaxID=156457 RepID=A0A8J7W6Z6_9EURY|nr:DUF4350 domain-containing protein [Methanocalculus chunghsingensis]MBR1368856.1 hypothetical protein [Methanocalculus chunghsingensis]